MLWFDKVSPRITHSPQFTLRLMFVDSTCSRLEIGVCERAEAEISLGFNDHDFPPERAQACLSRKENNVSINDYL